MMQTLAPATLRKTKFSIFFKEVIMKRLFFCLVLVLGFAQFNYLGAQEEQVYLGSIIDIPAPVASIQGAVVALSVYLGDPSGTAWQTVQYSAGQTWYMDIVVANFSSSTQSFKLEYDLRYGDGVGYKVTRTSNSIAGLNAVNYRIDVTSYVKKLGLFTLTGRVYGKGMGNDNKVTAQAYVF